MYFALSNEILIGEVSKKIRGMNDGTKEK